MEIKQHLTKVNYNKANKQNKYIVIHYTGNNGDTANANAKYFHSTYRGASANYFVDEHEIVQVVPDNCVAWHCESRGMAFKCGCRNNNSIGIELCSRKDKQGNYYFKEGTIKNSIELVVYLMKKYNIPIENVIRHYDVCGKLCPRPFIDNTAWEIYKTGVKNAFLGVNLNDKEEGDCLYQNIKEVPEWGKNTIRKLIEKDVLQM